MHDISSPLLTLAVYLAALVAGVLLFRRLGLGSAIAYLLVGALAGPAALGIVGHSETVAILAEFGVVLLLFAIGLELRPARLWRLRIDIIGLGSAQLVLTGAVIAVGLRFGLDWGWGVSVVTGAALALSSTAFGLQTLEDRKAIGTPFADRTISILLFQDLAVVPLLALVALSTEAGFSGPDAGHISVTAILIAVGSLAALVLIGHFAIGPMFRLIARSGAREAFTAGALLVVMGAALLTISAGLSAATGAVIAGVLLAESEFRDRIESDIDPFRALFIGLFFIGIGVNVDWRAVALSIHIALFGAVALFLVKGCILFALARIRGSSVADSLRTAVLLGQAGEFAFVLFGLAVASDVLKPEAASVLTAITALSMAMTPVAMRILDKFLERIERDAVKPEEAPATAAEPAAAPMVVIGYGRYGKAVTEILQRRGYDLVLVDKSPERVRVARDKGCRVFFGDLEHPGTLRSIERGGVRAIFVCIDEADTSRKAVARLRQRFPDAVLLARVRDRWSQWNTIRLGADRAVLEVFDSALAMAREGLTLLGDEDAADETIAEYKRDDAEQIEKLLAIYSRDEGGDVEDFELDDDKGRTSAS